MPRLRIWLVAAWLVGLAAVAATALRRAGTSTPGGAAPANRHVASGTYLVFVVVAPSGGAGEEYVDAVQEARRRFAAHAAANGYYFTAIGVAQQLNVDAGLTILGPLGPFDELIVGRSWFNSGIQLYAKDLGASEAIPQVIALLETIEVQATSWTLLERRELGRFLGDQLKAWELDGAPVPQD